MNTPICPHDCGMCNAPVTYDGHTDDGHVTYRCTACDWWHIDIDCCAPCPDCTNLIMHTHERTQP